MKEVTVRELRNHGARVLERVMRSEALTVTRDGRPVAELRPPPHRPIEAMTLLSRWRHLPAVDPAKLRADIDRLLDAAGVVGALDHV
jgi:prevent-host-death family protein